VGGDAAFAGGTRSSIGCRSCARSGLRRLRRGGLQTLLRGKDGRAVAVSIYYITNRFTFAGPGVEMNWPHYSEAMDYELEIGIITRRTPANTPTVRG
jgi:hypothetical protein